MKIDKKEYTTKAWNGLHNTEIVVDLSKPRVCDYITKIEFCCQTLSDNLFYGHIQFKDVISFKFCPYCGKEFNSNIVK